MGVVVLGGMAVGAVGGSGEVVVPTLGEVLRINYGVFGVNNNNAVSEMPTHDPAYAALFRGLHASTARYVGGSSISFWDWQRGKYIPEDEITKIWPAEHGNWMLPLVAEVDQLQDGDLNPASYAEFAASAEIDVQWMINLTTRAADQPAMMRQLHQQGTAVSFVELDNETYFWGAEFGGGRQRAERYADRVAEFVPTLRELYPDARVGIVASENGLFTDEMHKDEEAFRVWNRVITQPEYRPHFDAFILHHYVMNSGALDGVRGRDTEAQRLNQDALGRAFLSCPQVTLEHAVDALARDYGGVPMWITEYNVLGYYRIARDDQASEADRWIAGTAHTAWNALYQAGFWLTAMQHPEAIEILNHHSVTNVNLGWGLGLPVSETEADLTATGQLFAHLSTLYRGAVSTRQLHFESAPALADAFDQGDVVTLQGVSLERDGGLTWIVINRDASAIQLDLSATAADQAKVICYRTDQAAHDRTARVKLKGDRSTWEQGPMTAEVKQVNLGQASAVELPGFSLTILELK